MFKKISDNIRPRFGILKGEYEKRIFIIFFVITFLLVAIFTLLEWQLVRFGINQYEDKISNEVLEKIVVECDNFQQDKHSYLQLFLNDQNLIKALDKGRDADVSRIINRISGKDKPLILLFNAKQTQVYGNYLPLLEKYVLEIFRQYNHSAPSCFPAIYGKDTFLITYDYLVIEKDKQEKELLGVVILLDQFLLKEFASLNNLQLISFANIDEIEHIQLPDTHKHFVNKLRTLVRRSVTSNKVKYNFRTSIDTAFSAYIRCDIFGEPALFIAHPYSRDYNTFAHRGLIIFLLIILAMSFLMISLSGAWFSRKIIAPLEELNTIMKEIENNPANIVSIEKKYHGILGEITKTFNLMNYSLNRYSQSLLEYKIIINNLDSAILWMDGTFRIILCNPKALQLFDVRSYQDIIGRYLPELINLDEKLQKTAKEEGLIIPQLELNNPRNQKFVTFVIFSIRAVDDQGGLRFVASINDITKETREEKARERLEIELIKSNRLAELGRLVEGIVHNINSPLNSIVGYSQLIQKDHPELKDIEKIHQAGNNIAKMVKLLLSKIREDSISMMRPLDLNEIVDQELEMCHHNTFYSQNVTLIKNLVETDLKINATSGEISLCIANILNNAIQSMETKKEKILTVTTDILDNYLSLIIEDTGVGIAPEHVDRIFDPDFSTKREQSSSGFGLGLAISRSIIDKYRGSIEVKSTLGSGSTFALFFPYIKHHTKRQ